MRKMRAALILLFAVVMTMVACRRVPSGVMNEKRMASVLADLDWAESYVSMERFDGAPRDGMGASTDSLKKALLQTTLAAHGVTYDDFSCSLDWYGHNLDRYEDVCALRLQAIKDKQKRLLAAAAERGETVGSAEGDVVKTSLPATFSAGGYTGRYHVDFKLPKGSWRKGDRIKLRLRATSLTAPLTVVLGAEYADTLSRTVTRHLGSEGVHEVSLQLDSTLAGPRAVWGRINFPQHTLVLIDSVSVSVSRPEPSTYYDLRSQRVHKPRREASKK